MKNLFFVINKEKIYAYIVSIMTIVVIFFMSNLINSDLSNTELTTSNSIGNNIIQENNVNNIENENIQETSTVGEAISTNEPSNIEDINIIDNIMYENNNQ